jgi:ParB family chromosome partitioning protein
VRRHSSSAVEELAALIASQGLLHHLIVPEPPFVPGRKIRAKARFAVVAGQRQFRAL